jgi:hypothetical protein
MREVRLQERRFWILSEPTRGAADEAAERKLRRLLQAPWWTSVS